MKVSHIASMEEIESEETSEKVSLSNFQVWIIGLSVDIIERLAPVSVSHSNQAGIEK